MNAEQKAMQARQFRDFEQIVLNNSAKRDGASGLTPESLIQELFNRVDREGLIECYELSLLRLARLIEQTSFDKHHRELQETIDNAKLLHITEA